MQRTTSSSAAASTARASPGSLPGAAPTCCCSKQARLPSGASGGPGKRGVRANGRDVRELPLMRMAYECGRR